MNKKIFVLEDDLDIAENLKELLEIENYEVEISHNGKEALTKLASSARLPDLILLDLMMPVMDGLAFIQIQKNDSKISHIPVVVMTADGHIDLKKMKLHAAAFIRKPPDIDNVLNTIMKHVL